MTRRTGTPGWSAGGLGQPRPRRSRALWYVAAAIVIAIIIGWLLSRAFSGGTSCNTYYCSSSLDLAAPNGYAFATSIYSYNQGKGAPPQGEQANVQLPLTAASNDSRGLSFFSYDTTTRSWQPIGPATLDTSGRIAQATLTELPAVIAVLRRTSGGGGAVVAYLPHDAQLNPEAVNKITILHTLDFTPAPDGSIQGSLTTSRPAGSYQWMPVISANAGISGTVQTVQTILASPQSRTQHADAIVTMVQNAKAAGADIAYLDLPANERSSFTLFVQELAQKLHNINKELTLTLPPPTVNGDRIDEGAYDWAALGQVADLIELAPYRDQGTYRQNMPHILQYITSVVHPSAKIVLTVTPYASEKSDAGIRTLTLAQAMAIATQLQVNVNPGQSIKAGQQVIVSAVNIDKSDSRSGIVWQPETACVAFTYELQGGRTIWIENFYSVGFKLEYIPRYQLGGVAVEDASANPLLGNIWTAIVPFIASGQPILRQPNPKDLQPQWEVSDGAWQDTLKGEIQWNTPARPGTYTIKLTLSDGIARFQNQLSVAVVSATAATTPSATP